MRIFSYVIEHDLGFAPNPFFGVCTLACCKPRIRKYARIGDVVIGTGSKTVNRQGYLTYWMRVDQIISFEEYWHNPNFAVKKPNMNGSTIQRYGDNIYWRRPNTSEWGQLDSFHSEPDGSLSRGNLQKDTGTTDKILIGEEFSYWGQSGPKIPDILADFVVKSQGHKCRFSSERKDAFVAWIGTLAERGYVDEPANWQYIEV